MELPILRFLFAELTHIGDVCELDLRHEAITRLLIELCESEAD